MSFDPPPLPAGYGAFQVWWQQVRDGLKAEFGALEAANAANAAAIAAQAAATAAQSTANTAQTTANTAQSAANTAQTTANTANTNASAAQSTANTANTTATTVKRDNAISASHTEPGDILTANDAGSNARIVIANHSRVYDDGTNLSITGVTLTGKAYSTKYFIYYDDATRSDTTPSFIATTNASTAAYNKVAGRHYCGSVTTPAAGGSATTGGTTAPGGGSEPIDYR